MQLVHKVANLGTDTISTVSGQEDISSALSGDLSFFRQAVTPWKPHTGIVSQMTSNSHTGEEGFGGIRVLHGVAGVLDSLHGGSLPLTLPLALDLLIEGESFQQPSQVVMGIGSFPTLEPWVLSSLQPALWLLAHLLLLPVYG